MRQLIEAFSVSDSLGFNHRVAIVAPSNTIYGVSRMYQMMRGDDAPEEIRVFRDLVEATDWLDSGLRERDGDGNRGSVGGRAV